MAMLIPLPRNHENEQKSPIPGIQPTASGLDASSGLNRPFKLEQSIHLLTPSELLMDQFVTMQIESQKKQMGMMGAITDTKGGRRLEPAFGCCLEKPTKAKTDALWARFQEEIAKHEELSHNRTQETTYLISKSMNTVLSIVVRKIVMRDIFCIGKAVAQSLTPIIDKALPSTIYKVFQEFQKGANEKIAGLLEIAIYSTLEDTVAGQIRAQFLKSGQQALQETLKSTLAASVIPALDMSCKAVFEQVDGKFQKVLTEHVAAVQQQFELLCSPSAHALKVMTMQKGCQKQPGMLFAISDALWAPLQEEVEKLSHRCTLEITNLILNFVSKDLSVAVEKEVKKEIASVGKIVVQALIPVIEKGLPLAIYEVFQEFQKGGADKTVDLLEKAIYSKLEATMATQIQAQFQKSGKQVIQEALKSTLEASIIPAFDLSCKEVFEQIDAQFQKVMTENVAAVQQQFESLRSPSAHSLKDAFSPMHSKTMLTVRESSWL